MGWENHKSKKYFYLHQRLPDGRKVKKYFGRGVDAQMASVFLELRKFAKWSHQQAMSKLKAETQEADELLNKYSESVSEFVTAEMLAVGFHNSRSRGWRKMMKTDLKPEKEMTTDSAGSVKKKPGRPKGTTRKNGKNSKPISSPVSQKRVGPTTNSSESAATSPGRSTARISGAEAEALRLAGKQFRENSAVPPMDDVGYSEASDAVDTEDPQPAKPLEEMSPDELIAAAEKGDTAAMNRLSPMMQKYPHRFTQIGDLGALALEKWLDVHCHNKLYLRECLKVNLAEMRAQHLEEGNSPIERLLVEELLLSWLRHYFWISREAGSLSQAADSKLLEFNADQTRGTQRMYLKAIAELRKFRDVKARLPSRMT